MKPTERIQEQSAELLIPDYGFIAEKVAAYGVVRNEQDIYLGKVRACFAKESKAAEFCWCANAYESKESVSSNASQDEYGKKIICVSVKTGSADIFAACDVEVEEIKPGSIFEYDGVCRMLPRYKALKEPYVMSLADALELYHKFGFVKVKVEDIFIGAFYFRNFKAEVMPYPDIRKHFGIGLCYMVDVIVDGKPCVAVVRAFNETRPKTVICNPLTHSVICRYQLSDTFRTVCGWMTLVDGVMKHRR